MPPAPLLEVQQVSASYGRVRALDNVSLSVYPGEIVALIGPNGGGKTTLFAVIAGLLPATPGEVRFGTESFNGVPTHERAARGLMLVPEGRGVLTTLSVLENLLMGAYHRRDRDRVQGDLEAVFQRFPILRERQSLGAGTLSGGQQQMLAIGRALMARPRIMLMDEPSFGLAPAVVAEVIDLVSRLPGEGITVLLAEQNAHMALNCAGRAYVLEAGRIQFEGTSDALMNDARVRAAYLGAESSQVQAASD